MFSIIMLQLCCCQSHDPFNEEFKYEKLMDLMKGIDQENTDYLISMLPSLNQMRSGNDELDIEKFASYIPSTMAVYTFECCAYIILKSQMDEDQKLFSLLQKSLKIGQDRAREIIHNTISHIEASIKLNKMLSFWVEKSNHV